MNKFSSQQQLQDVKEEIMSLPIYPEMEVTCLTYHVVYWIGASMRFYGHPTKSLDEAKVMLAQAENSCRQCSIIRVTSYFAKLQ